MHIFISMHLRAYKWMWNNYQGNLVGCTDPDTAWYNIQIIISTLTTSQQILPFKNNSYLNIAYAGGFRFHNRAVCVESTHLDDITRSLILQNVTVNVDLHEFSRQFYLESIFFIGCDICRAAPSFAMFADTSCSGVSVCWASTSKMQITTVLVEILILYIFITK